MIEYFMWLITETGFLEDVLLVCGVIALFLWIKDTERAEEKNSGKK